MAGTLQPITIFPGSSGEILATEPKVFVEVLSGSGNWTCPAGVTIVTVRARAPGGGGGTRKGAVTGGAGGGGGAYAEADVTTTPGNSYPYDCGTGGGGGVWATSSLGQDGANTTFNTSTVIAAGGKGASLATGAVGGLAADCTGDTKLDGGSGGDGSTVVGDGGGGGGSSADEGGDGNAGASSSGSGTGGAGGAAVDDDGAGGDGGTASAGLTGDSPGGGGGGGADGFDGASGADGEIVLEWEASGVVEAQWTAPASFLVMSVSNVDGTLTIAPTTGAVIASINLAHANLWTGQQSFTKLVLSLSVDNTFAFTLTTATP